MPLGLLSLAASIPPDYEGEEVLDAASRGCRSTKRLPRSRNSRPTCSRVCRWSPYRAQG